MFTISQDEVELEGAAWSHVKNNSLYLPLESWEEIKKYLLEMCERNNNCPDVNNKIQKLGLN